MNKFKWEVMPVISGIFERGQEWFSRLINASDHAFTKVTTFIGEQKKQMSDYIKDRNKLLLNINDKQNEIEYLRKKVEQISHKERENILKVREKLDVRTEELIESQKQYIQVQKKVDKSRKKLLYLTNEKERIQTDRNLLKSEYENLQLIMKENVEQVAILTNELLELNKQLEIADISSQDSKLDSSIQNEIEEKESELARLNQLNYIYGKDIKELEKNLMIEVRRYSELNSQFQLIQTELAQNEKIIKELNVLINKNEHDIQTERRRVEKLELERTELLAIANNYEENYRIALMEYESMNAQIQQADEEYLQSMEAADEKITCLQNELLKEQNELAIAQQKNGEPIEIPQETLKVLEQEYEPRFETLYRNSVFKPEFFKDFYILVPSDRLKVEASIVNINYNFELHKSKIRPNEVLTQKGTKILEYPFGHDHIGRIYFRRASNEIYFYRISRTKNGKGKLNQKRVINWLKGNC